RESDKRLYQARVREAALPGSSRLRQQALRRAHTQLLPTYGADTLRTWAAEAASAVRAQQADARAEDRAMAAERSTAERFEADMADLAAIYRQVVEGVPGAATAYRNARVALIERYKAAGASGLPGLEPSN